MSDSHAPALRVRDLRKTYDNGVEALKGVSLDVQPGDFYALLGPNGAGKSTLIGIVSSLVNKSAGEVAVFGTDIGRDRDGAMRLLGLVYNLHGSYEPDMVRDTLRECRRALRDYGFAGTVVLVPDAKESAAIAWGPLLAQLHS